MSASRTDESRHHHRGCRRAGRRCSPGPQGARPPADEPPHGVAVPGLTSDKVSGEASGVRAVLRLNEAFITASAALSSFVRRQHARVRRGPRSPRPCRAPMRTPAISGSIFESEAGFDPEVELPAAGGGPVKDEEDKVLLDGPFGPITLARSSVKTQGR